MTTSAIGKPLGERRPRARQEGFRRNCLKSRNPNKTRSKRCNHHQKQLRHSPLPCRHPALRARIRVARPNHRRAVLP